MRIPLMSFDGTKNSAVIAGSRAILTVYLCLLFVFLSGSNANAEPVSQFSVIARVKDQYGIYLNREEIISWRVMFGRELIKIDKFHFAKDEGRSVLNLDAPGMPKGHDCVTIVPVLSEEQFFTVDPMQICRGDDKDNVLSVYRRLMHFSVHVTVDGSENWNTNGVSITVPDETYRVQCKLDYCEVYIERPPPVVHKNSYKIQVVKRGYPALMKEIQDGSAPIKLIIKNPEDWLSIRASYVHSLDRIVSNGFGATLEWNRLVREIAPQRRSGLWWESILAVNTYFGTAQEQQATLPGIEPYETVKRPSFFGTVEGGLGIAAHLSAQLYLNWLTTVHLYYERQEAVKFQDGEFSVKEMWGGGIGTYLNMSYGVWNRHRLYILAGVGYRHTGVFTLARSEFNFFGPKTNSSEGGSFGKLQFSIGPAFRF
jgi:hypothetical protein